MKTIEVETPIYDKASGIATTKLISDSGGKANLIVDFKTILPFTNLVAKEVLDFFLFTSAVYGIDRFIDRKRNSVDGWSRELKVTFPVSDSKKWNAQKEELNKLLSFLTGDYWNVDFRRAVFNP